MNTDQLKMIVDLIASLGVQGKEAFIWYLALTEGLGFIRVLLLASVAAYVVLRVVIIVAAASDEEKNLRQIRSMLGVGSGGYYDGDDHKAVINKLMELKK